MFVQPVYDTSYPLPPKENRLSVRIPAGEEGLSAPAGAHGSVGCTFSSCTTVRRWQRTSTHVSRAVDNRPSNVDRVAALAAARGAHPVVVWHSGKLRAKQTAEAYWKACNALAEFSVRRICSPMILHSGFAIACVRSRAT